jgi:hypothetical protein
MGKKARRAASRSAKWDRTERTQGNPVDPVEEVRRTQALMSQTVPSGRRERAATEVTQIVSGGLPTLGKRR